MAKKVFISAGIEGVASVVSRLQTAMGEFEYRDAQRLMTLEVNAAIAGAQAAGAEQFVVCDAHANMQNLLPELLHQDAELVRGSIRQSLQMQGMDSSFDAVFITGSHAGAGTKNAVLDHTWVGASVLNIRIDGVTMNEACLNDVVAGFYGAPTVLVTGDEATIAQTREILPHIEGAVVKHSYSRFAARSLHPEKARQVIYDAAFRAIQRAGDIPVTNVPDEITMEIDFYRTDAADAAELVPMVERLSDRTVRVAGAPEFVFGMQNLLLYRLKYE